MNPSPLSTAFPALCAQVQEERPILVEWLSHVTVTEINDGGIRATTDARHAYDGLIMPHSKNYLNSLAAKHLDSPTCTFDLRLNLPPAESTVGTPARAVSDPVRLPEPPPSPPVPTTTAPDRRQHNKLTLPNQVKLVDWVRDHKEEVRTETDAKLAAMAAAALEFPVTPSNLVSTREALGIAKAVPATPPTTEERLADLESQIEKLRDIIEYHTTRGHLPAIPLSFADEPTPAA